MHDEPNGWSLLVLGKTLLSHSSSRQEGPDEVLRQPFKILGKMRWMITGDGLSKQTFLSNQHCEPEIQTDSFSNMHITLNVCKTQVLSYRELIVRCST